MAAAHTKQLEDKLARYERVMSECRRCKAALASEEVDDGTPSSVPKSSAGSSGQTAPKTSSTNSALPSKKPSTKKVQPTRSSKKATSTSRAVPPPEPLDVVDPSSLVSASASRGEKTAKGPSPDTVRPSSRLSKPTIVETVPSLPDYLSTQHTSTTYSLRLRPTSLGPSTSGAGSLSAHTNRLNTSGPNLSMSDSDTGKHLHSSTRSSLDHVSRSSQDDDSASESRSFHTARQSADSTSSSLQLNPTRFTASGDMDGVAYLRSLSHTGRQSLPKDDHENSTPRDPTTNQTAADSRTSKRMITDRSAKPLGDPNTVRRRRPPVAVSSNGELLISTSLGESRPAISGSKRPLPESPPSQSQSDNTTRRRRRLREEPSSEDMDPPSRPGKKDSHRQRGRA